MKRISAIALVFAFFAVAMLAQATGHKTTMTWTAPTDSTATTTYHVYRAVGVCPVDGSLGTLSYARIDGVSSAITATSYTDVTIGVGNWCYYVTAFTAGIESAPSNTSGGTAQPLAPTANKDITN